MAQISADRASVGDHGNSREAEAQKGPQIGDEHFVVRVARAFGVEALDRALHGIPGPTIVHMCFGYAYVVKEKPSGYSFLPELAQCCAAQISIEAAEPRLDLAVLEQLPAKTIR